MVDTTTSARPADRLRRPAGTGGDGAAKRPASVAKPVARANANAFAAIDLGTNNCRLLIARPVAGEFTVIDAFSRVVRLGEGLSASGRLSEAAMDRAIAALATCADKVQRRRVVMARSVATEACRQAANGAEFVARVRERTGIQLEIISAEEEARLAVLGCHALLEPGAGPALIFDIGGGSTELVLVETGHEEPVIRDWHSVPWGVVSLTESERHDDRTAATRLAAFAAMRAKVLASFAAFAERVSPAGSGSGSGKAGPLRLLGTSGTVTTLAGVHLGLPRYDRAAVDGLILPAAAMRAVSARLSALSLAERATVDCVGSERADLVVGGCAILEAILDIWPAERLGVADRGIREGIVRTLIARHGRGG